jgi:hypothetical protein
MVFFLWYMASLTVTEKRLETLLDHLSMVLVVWFTLS